MTMWAALLSMTAVRAEAAPGQDPAGGQAGLDPTEPVPFTIEAARVRAPLRVDGVLDDALYQR